MKKRRLAENGTRVRQSAAAVAQVTVEMNTTPSAQQQVRHTILTMYSYMLPTTCMLPAMLTNMVRVMYCMLYQR